MQKIKRKMEVEIIPSSDYLYCQASFNSDGRIVFRNYSIHNKNEDEIIALSAGETQALFELFRKIKSSKMDLPF